ncbi:MAG: rod shape-determining protein RodA [Candidatus Aureabacteria bacterium]|nr:rod shape-determining protein RodA [Candidatus Auribacterota bacterium]
MIDLSPFRHVNWGIIAAAVAIMLLGLAFIYSGAYQLGQDTGSAYVHRQFIWGIAGLCGAMVLAMVVYRRLASSALFIYLGAILLLVMVLLTADPRRGARSWFSTGGFAVQPSEFAKIALIIALARFLSREDLPRGSPVYFAGALGISLLPMLLILKQPDLGTAMVLIPVVAAMMIVAGVSRLHLVYLVLTGLLSLPLGWAFLRPFQQARIRVFLNPQLDPLKSGYNAIQSLIAVASGGLWGRGWLHGTQTHLRFLPERHTDFIFSVLGEEAGFAGCVFLITLYAIIIFGGLRIAGVARDEFGRLAAVGITVLLASHVVINIGMTIGLLPITGLPLPLMSYGGSSLLSTCLCLGILESICARRYIF